MTKQKNQKFNLLKLAEYHDSCLRKATKPVNFPLSEEDQQTIHDMKYSIQPEQLKKAGAPWDAAVGMAANQWGIDKQIFIYCPEGDSTKLEVIINPSYEPIINEATGKAEQEEEWEGCFSVPLATGNVRRFKKIRVTYQNEIGEVITKELTDWFARVWQHENDHLLGHLYDDPSTQKCLIKNVFETREKVDEFYDSIREERKHKIKKSHIE